jgi:hypothetical protein
MTNRIFEIEGETNSLEPKVKSTNEPVLNIDNMDEEPIMLDEQYDDEIIEEPVIEEPVIKEPVIEEPVIEEPVIEEPVIESSEELIVGRVKEPVIPTGKIQLEDIREIKNRGYSVNVPNPKNTNNTIERISSNKYN